MTTRAISGLVAFVLAALAPSPAILAQSLAIDSKQSEAADEPPTLYLHTHFFPYRARPQRRERRFLLRELPRQALLVAARHELGLIARDQTLGETHPDNALVKHLTLAEKGRIDQEKLILRIIDHDGPHDLAGLHDISVSPWRHKSPWGMKAAWQQTFPFDPDLPHTYAALVPELERASRKELVEALTTLGFQSQAERDTMATRAEHAIPPAWEETLRQPDFIAQFGVVKQCHDAIDENGETDERLGVLARGYTHLAVLTNHQWNGVSFAYAARALLYAQRMVAKGGDQPSDMALWHRAYAWGVFGIHNNALKDLDTLADRDSKTPEWAMPLKPYCHCDIVALEQLAQASEALAPWATCLRFRLIAATRYSHQMYLAGMDVAKQAPTAYVAYAQLAQTGHSLAAIRSGASFAPRAFTHFVPRSLDVLSNVPERLKTALPSNADRKRLADVIARDPDPNDQFSSLPGYYASELYEQARQEAFGALSWSALAYLLEEEMFVQVANHFKVAMNATESSHDKEIDNTLPLIKDHRYAKYIESYRFNPRREQDSIMKVAHGIEIRDCRGCMARMAGRVRDVSNELRDNEVSFAWSTVRRELTMSGVLETTFIYGGVWKVEPSEGSRSLANRYRAIVPHSEVGLRMLISQTEDATLDQVKQWDEEVKADADALRMIGDWYAKFDQPAAAVRCYEKSLASVHNFTTAKSLAQLYRKLDQLDDWEQLWLDFLKHEDSTSDDYFAQLELAHEYIRRGQYEKAKPYAMQAAQIWGTIALGTASLVCEGLAEWRQSEYWIREKSTNYPTGHAHEWFFWCCRTGRGDKADAAKHAEAYFANPPKSRTRSFDASSGVYHLLLGDERRAYEDFQLALAHYPSYTYTFMVAQLARRLGKEEAREAALQAFRNHMASENFDDDKNDPAVYQSGLAILELLETGDASAEEVKSLERLIRSVDISTRTAFAYIAAAEFDALGNKDAAVNLWQKGLCQPGDSFIFATLCGFELAKQNGTSRPDNDKITQADLWNSVEAAKE